MEQLFHTYLRNICLFISLTFICLTYVKTFPKLLLGRIIISIGLISLYISHILNQKMIKEGNKDPMLRRIPKLLFIIQIIILFYIINLLVFKNMK